ncbi:MAG: zinc-binding dehydrogenase [Mycobacterium sp.]
MVVTEFGGPEVMVLRNWPDPEPGVGQVLVDVEFSDVGTLDRLIRAGKFAEVFNLAPPYVPGGGVGGVVRTVGPGVDTAWVGKRVVGGTSRLDADGRSAVPTGGYAELALIDERALNTVPDGLDLDVATSLFNDGPTSQQLFDVAVPTIDDHVLVLAAAGAAGTLLVQMLTDRGVPVVAAARGAEKTAAVRALGATAVVDYGEPDWPERVGAVFADGPTVVFDGAGAELGRTAFMLAADGARVISYGTSAGEFAELSQDEAHRRGVVVTGLFDLPPLGPPQRATLLQRAFTAALDGAARPLLNRVALAHAAEAHAALEDRTAIGKTILTVA